MTDEQRIAWAKLEAFRGNLPKSDIDEDTVAEWHGILDALHRTFRYDLTAFRVSDRDLTKKVISMLRTSDFSSRRATPDDTLYSDKRSCTRAAMQKQIDGVVYYFDSVARPTEEPTKRTYGF